VAVGGQTGSSSGGDSNSWTCLSYYSLGRYAEAAAAYEALLATDQSYYTTAQIYSCIAKCRVLLGSYDEAIIQCNAGLNTGDTSEAGTLYALRATSYMAKKRI
jgi:tetratricopeptide (TPR) repeat protein